MNHRYFRHIALFFTLSFFFCAYAKAQEIYRQKNDVIEFKIDDRGRMLITDSFELYYKTPAIKTILIDDSFSASEYLDLPGVCEMMFGDKCEELKDSLKSNSPIDLISRMPEMGWSMSYDFGCELEGPEKEAENFRFFDNESWALLDSSAHKICDDEEYHFDYVISDLVLFDDKKLVATQGMGLWVCAENKARKLYSPGVEFPSDIETMDYQDGILLIKTKEDALLAYDTEKQILSGVASDVSLYDRDKWNVIYYSSGNRIYKFIDQHNDLAPDLFINDVYINNRWFNPDNLIHKGVLVQGYDLKFDLESYYSPDPNEIRYQYSIASGNWIDCAKEVVIPLNKSGQLVVSFRLGTEDGNYSKPQSFKLHVSEKISQTLWPYLFGILAFFFMIAFVSLLRSRSKYKQAKREREKMELQIDLLKTQQRLKQAQMNPHFLYNALNALKGLVVLGETRKAADGIGQFAMLMRSLLEKMDAENISIEEELEFLHAYLKLEQSIRAFEFDYKIETGLSEIEIPSLMIQPFVENAIIHGLSRYVADRSVSIILERESYYLKVMIIDKGRGAKEEATSIKTHESKAGQLFTERCAKLDRFSREDYLLYEKESYPDGSSQTSCILYIPINRI